MRYPVSNFTSVCFYMYTYPQPPTGPRPHPLYVTRIAPRGAGIEGKTLKTLLLGTDMTSICVKIGVVFVVFSQQCRLFATGMHKHHTRPWGVTFLPHPLAHMHTGAHTRALRTHAHTYAQAHTRPGASAYTQAQPRERVPFPREKQKRISKNESPRESPRNRPNESPQNTAQHSKNTPTKKKV